MKIEKEYITPEPNDEELFDYLLYSFKIDNMANLKDYEITYESTHINEYKLTNDRFRLILPVNFDGETKTYNVNKEANFQGKKVLLKDVQVSPLSCKVTIKELNGEVNLHDTKTATIKMKDGKLLGEDIQHRIVFTPGDTSTQQLCISFFQIIDPRDIKSFIFGDLEIPLN